MSRWEAIEPEQQYKSFVEINHSFGRGEPVEQHAIERKIQLNYWQTSIFQEIERILRLKFEKNGFIEI